MTSNFRKHLFGVPDTKLLQQSLQLTLLIMATSFLVVNLLLWVSGEEWQLTSRTEPDAPSLTTGVIVPIALALASYTMLDTPSNVIKWIAAPSILTATIGSGFSNAIFEDYSVVAQLHHFVPTIVAAYCLYRQGAWLTYATAIVTHGAWSWSVAGDTSFIDDWVMVSGVMAVITHSLTTVRANQASTHATLVERLRRDGLTGLLNRQAFDRKVPHPAALTPAAGDAMLIFDIDHFKSLNDVHGHPAGDAVLQQVAEILSAVVGESGFVFRVGGDEFVAYLPDQSLDFAESIAQRIVYNIGNDPFEVPSGADPAAATASLQVTCSIGVAHWPTDQRHFATLYAAADAALYAAKDRGRCTYATTATLPRTPRRGAVGGDLVKGDASTVDAKKQESFNR